MRVTEVRLINFRRFTNLEIRQIPPDTRLVVLAGPNGVGKSSVFDGLRASQNPYLGGSSDAVYLNKATNIGFTAPQHQATITFDRPIANTEDGRRSVYIRTAYRHEAEFALTSISSPSRVLDMPRPMRMIEPEVAVSQNYQQLIGQTMNGLYSRKHDSLSVAELRDLLIGEIRTSMMNVFDDLLLEGINDPFTNGTFFFQKGVSHGWPYKNLSGGERAAFDILLDLIIKRPVYTDTVYCIDEPETHLNTRVQGKLLREMLRIIPENCQLWIASHSIGMMREAWGMQEEGRPVIFLDFADRDFDSEVIMTPVVPDRRFWQKTLSHAVGDLADLVAPKEVVLVEGRPRVGNRQDRGNVEFDARCLRRIFGDVRPQAGFVSVGNADAVEDDKLALGEGLRTLVPGATVIRLIDRDDRSDDEVNALVSGLGGRVLGLRDLENYLLSDELLKLLCAHFDRAEMSDTVVAKKSELLSESVRRGKPSDDVKAIAGDLYVYLKRELSLRQVGNSSNAFLSDTMAPLMTPSTATFLSLESSIFG